ncbi:MAG TPA: TetR/AcrR family transcriptional regulator [Pseudonocardiaceae bacterium]
MSVTVDRKHATRSFTASARRAQIITATIAVIAEEGFARASFARIARRAGLSSTRLISYHFAGKDELVSATAEYVIGEISEFMAARVAKETDGPGRLRAYVEGNIEFIAGHRPEMTALLNIVLAGGIATGMGAHHTAEFYLEGMLRQGQADGQFRAFDAHVIASAVQRSIESLPFALAAEPNLDTKHYARELVTLFDLGTRRDSP